MKRKVYITMYKSFQMMALYEDERLVELYADSSEEQSILDRIYIGKVKNIVKNINAAFIDIGSVEGYYSLKENPLPFYTNGKEAHAALMPGDEVLVQVCRENIKTKAPALTSKISLAGKYIVLELDAGKSMSASVDKNNLVRQISVSSKIKDKNERVKNL